MEGVGWPPVAGGKIFVIAPASSANVTYVFDTSSLCLLANSSLAEIVKATTSHGLVRALEH
jgi:homoserine kinase